MSAAKSMNAYLNNHYEGMTPEKLIHMLYTGALEHLAYAREGVIKKDPKQRGEHLSKVISIISELNTSISPEADDESTRVLRGLYASMLAELPKVSISNDLKTLDVTRSYLEKLNEIWETQVLNRTNQTKKPVAEKKAVSSYGGGYESGSTDGPKSIFA
ncbi:MAG: flagellar export chaperone FliS [Desulfobacterales bacterium]|nr:flagellar export chaperone FliS [Desulfobacterales bacterium]